MQHHEIVWRPMVWVADEVGGGKFVVCSDDCGTYEEARDVADQWASEHVVGPIKTRVRRVVVKL